MSKKKKEVVVIMSGGMDSTVLLYQCLKYARTVRALGIDYGQRHRRELDYAQRTCESLRVPFRVVDLSALSAVLPGSSQTDISVPVPEGHYSEETMKATVVPNRNMIMLSIAIGHAVAHKFHYVAFGAHAGDHTIYPDCREKFAVAMNRAARVCDWTKVSLLRPFVTMSKADIASLGAELGVDFSKTYSCYKGEEKHCGKCGTCVERREALYLAGITDTTMYMPSAPSLAEMVAANWKL